MAQDQFKNRALELFQSGQGADFVIEVVPQIDGQDPEKKVFSFILLVHFTRLCHLILKKRILRLYYQGGSFDEIFSRIFLLFFKFFSTVILLADHEYRIYKSYFGIDLLFKVVENTGILHQNTC
jgi:hypothetical protein